MKARSSQCPAEALLSNKGHNRPLACTPLRAKHIITMSCSHVVADEVARGNFEDTGPDRDWGDRNEALLALQRLWISAF